jgi:hypothetical protein
MKQNWLQVLSLVLCLVLLFLVLRQNWQIKQQYSQLESELYQLRTELSDELQNVSFGIRQELEETERLIADYTLQPSGISKEDHTLLADVSVSLKEWYFDTQVTLTAECGDTGTSLTADTDGAGTYTAQIAIPLDGTDEVLLSAHISGGGMTRQEAISSWSDISMLLPLQYSGSSWDGPNYVNGTLSSNFTMDIRGRDGTPGLIKEPRFLVYRNGELAQTIPAVLDPYSDSSYWSGYTTASQGYRWQLECDPGDTIDIRFLCQDEYGLGYDFLFTTWIAGDDNSGATFQSGSYPLYLFWPE